MDIKITKNRLKNLLSYDWIAILISVIVACVVWSLLFTTCATRISVGQDFYLVIYEDIYNKTDKASEKLLSDVKQSSLSYDILKTNVQNIVTAGAYSAGYMLNLRLTTQEGDMLAISTGRNGETFDEDGKSNIEGATQIESLINNGYMYSIPKLLNDSKEYLTSNNFITINEDGSYVFHEDNMESYFRNVRMKDSKYKKMYRNEQEISKAVKLEIERIKNIYFNYLSVTQAIEKAKQADNDILYYFTPYYTDENGNITEYLPKDAYAIDLGKLKGKVVNGKKNDIADVWYTSDGKEGYTSNGMLLATFNFKSKQPDLQFECLSFIKYVISNYSDYCD